MHPHLSPLPQPLLHALGRAHSKDMLANALGVSLSQLVARAEPTAVHARTGLDLMVQCVNPMAEEVQQQWGLHSFTLQASDWPGPWPQGVDAKSSSSDVASAFNAEGETTLVLPNMACFTVAGLDGKVWSLLCSFSGSLLTFSLIYTGTWILSGDTAA